jgi:hypothetical protein
MDSDVLALDSVSGGFAGLFVSGHAIARAIKRFGCRDGETARAWLVERLASAKRIGCERGNVLMRSGPVVLVVSGRADGLLRVLTCYPPIVERERWEMRRARVFASHMTMGRWGPRKRRLVAQDAWHWDGCVEASA